MKKAAILIAIAVIGVFASMAVAAYALGGDSQPKADETKPTGHISPDSKRADDVVGSRGTVLQVKATHGVFDSGGGTTTYELVWPDGLEWFLAQDDVCVGSDSIGIVVLTSESGGKAAVAVVPHWLESSAGLTQGGQDMQAERFNIIDGQTDILYAPDAEADQRVDLSGVDTDALAAKLKGCAYGGVGR